MHKILPTDPNRQTGTEPAGCEHQLHSQFRSRRTFATGVENTCTNCLATRSLTSALAGSGESILHYHSPLACHA